MLFLLAAPSLFGQATMTTARLLGKTKPLGELPALITPVSHHAKLKNKQFEIPNFGRNHPMPRLLWTRPSRKARIR